MPEMGPVTRSGAVNDSAGIEDLKKLLVEIKTELSGKIDGLETSLDLIKNIVQEQINGKTRNPPGTRCIRCTYISS